VIFYARGNQAVGVVKLSLCVVEKKLSEGVVGEAIGVSKEGQEWEVGMWG
jgi:hypothetical protein